jgi:hypothetical protein
MNKWLRKLRIIQNRILVAARKDMLFTLNGILKTQQVEVATVSVKKSNYRKYSFLK